MSFLPADYVAPKGGSDKYMKFQEGDNRFRVLGSAVTGNELWIAGRPVRKAGRFDRDELERSDPGKDGGPQKERHFWAFPVWDYADSRVKVLAVTQSGIRDSMHTLVNDEEWGDPKGYDLVVRRSGEGLETSYSVIPKPKKPLADDQKAALKEVLDRGFDIQEYLTGGDPFSPAPKDAKGDAAAAVEDIEF